MNKHAVVLWMASCTVWLLSVNTVLCLIILSSAVTTGREDLKTGGRLFVYSCCCFSVFLQQSRVGLRGFVSRDKRSSRTDWGPPQPMCLCLFSSTQEHMTTHLTSHKHILSPLHTFTLSEGRLLRHHLSLLLPPEGSSVNKGKQVCFCLGCRPQAIPIMALFSRNEGPTTPLLLLPLFPSLSLSPSVASFSHKHKHQHPQTSPLSV